MNTFKILNMDPSRIKRLANTLCPYCGKSVSPNTATKEHVIGRRFVPKGVFGACWNLVLWTCEDCNNKKSDLEDDISSITMAFHAAGLPEMNDEILKREAHRKSIRSISQKTGKPVSNSAETLNLKIPLSSNLTISAKFNAPPQLDDERVLELARLQLVGFFYLLTYDMKANRGNWWRNKFIMLNGAIKSDWGNETQCAFMHEVAEWDYRLICSTAEGYYRAAIRRHPSAECWSWALEWNKTFRAIGFFGDELAAREIISRIPKPTMSSMPETPDQWFRFRAEEKLEEDDDILFHFPNEANQRPTIRTQTSHHNKN